MFVRTELQCQFVQTLLIGNDQPLSSSSSFMCYENGCSLFLNKYQFACPPAMISPVRPQLRPLHNTLHSLHSQQPPWCHAVCMPSLCHLFVDCWHVVCFLFLLSVFSCTVLHWGGPLHPLPIPVCSPPAHSCLAFILSPASLLFLLTLLLILSPFWTGPPSFELRHFSSFRGMITHTTCLHLKSPGALIKSQSYWLIFRRFSFLLDFDFPVEKLRILITSNSGWM